VSGKKKVSAWCTSKVYDTWRVGATEANNVYPGSRKSAELCQHFNGFLSDKKKKKRKKRLKK
jgi:hypothetical protein